MADWPADGVTNWNATMKAFVDVEHNTDGTHKVETILTDSEAQYTYADVDGTPTKVYTKYLTGTLDADAETVVVHGITGIDKILSVVAFAYNSSTSKYRVSEVFSPSVAAHKFYVRFDATFVIFSDVGANVQGQKYRIKIDYIL